MKLGGGQIDIGPFEAEHLTRSHPGARQQDRHIGHLRISTRDGLKDSTNVVFER
jgi:hypothetical protein